MSGSAKYTFIPLEITKNLINVYVVNVYLQKKSLMILNILCVKQFNADLYY